MIVVYPKKVEKDFDEQIQEMFNSLIELVFIQERMISKGQTVRD